MIGGVGVGLGAATTALLAARWLGRDGSLLAGLIDALMGGFLAGHSGTSGVLFWVVYGLLTRWSIGSFAIANLGGLLPLWRGNFVKWGFWLGLAGCWLLAGWQGTLLPAGVCLLSLVWLEDAQSLKFFVFPTGWLAAGGLVGGAEILRLFGPREWTAWVGLAGESEETTSFLSFLSLSFLSCSGLPETSLSWGGIGILWGGVGILWGVGLFLAIAAGTGVWMWISQGGLRSPAGNLFGAWAIAAGAGLVLEILRTEGLLLGRIPSSENGQRLAILVTMLTPPWAVAASVGCRRLRFLLHRMLLP